MELGAIQFPYAASNDFDFPKILTEPSCYDKCFCCLWMHVVDRQYQCSKLHKGNEFFCCHDESHQKIGK